MALSGTLSSWLTPAPLVSMRRRMRLHDADDVDHVSSAIAVAVADAVLYLLDIGGLHGLREIFVNVSELHWRGAADLSFLLQAEEVVRTQPRHTWLEELAGIVKKFILPDFRNCDQLESPVVEHDASTREQRGIVPWALTMWHPVLVSFVLLDVCGRVRKRGVVSSVVEIGGHEALYCGIASMPMALVTDVDYRSFCAPFGDALLSDGPNCMALKYAITRGCNGHCPFVFGGTSSRVCIRWARIHSASEVLLTL